MADKSSYWRDAVIDVLTGRGISAITPYVSLHTADPGLTGTSEVSGGGYSRTAVTFSAASSGAVSLERLTGAIAALSQLLDTNESRAIVEAARTPEKLAAAAERKAALEQEQI